MSRPSRTARSRHAEPELIVEAIGAQGDGVARHDGHTVYVPLAAPGDRVRVRLGGKRGDGVEGLAVELVAPGPQRAEPPCRHFGACGGCLLQHVSMASYGAWKSALPRRALDQRGLHETALAPLVTVPPAARRRATLAARRGRSGVFLGFNERESRRIVDLADCLVLRPALVALLPDLRALLAGLLAESEAMDVSATVLDDGIDVVLTADRDPDLSTRERLAAFAERADLARLSWRRDRDPAEPIAHRRPGNVRFGGVAVTVPPGGFLQATAEGEAALTGLILDALGDPAGRPARIADLFCGAGAFSFPLARHGRVLALDAEAEAIAALGRAARETGLSDRIEARPRDLFRDPLTAGELDGFDAVVFYPPRQGARAQAAELAASKVPVVVGVSCSPASFARDARTLVDGGYRLDRVTPIDQFPWTPHLELAGVFRR